MEELIIIKNEGYERYEELLFEREKLYKEVHILELNYMQEFGDISVKIFEKKIECIKKKKALSFCQAALNHGNNIDQNKLNEFLKKEMKDYNDKLNKMIKDNNDAKSATFISAGKLREIKKLYKKLAKLLHPDINPKTNEIPELKRLWNMITVSYRANSLTELKDAEILLNKVLKDMGLETMEIEIKDIDEKIASIEEEITDIKLNNPYQYKYLLQDKAAIKDKKDEMNKELDEYTSYEKELDKMMDELLKNGGVSITWTII